MHAFPKFHLETNRVVSLGAVAILGLFFPSTRTTVDPTHAVGPRIQSFGWDLKGNMDLCRSPQAAAELFQNGPANLVRIPIFTRFHTADGRIRTEAYAPMMESLKNIRALRPNIPIFASLKLQSTRTFPPWMASDESGRIAGMTAARPDADKYAHLLAEYIQYLDQQGIILSYLGPSNETDHALDPARFVSVVRKLRAELPALGVSQAAQNFAIVAPDTFGLGEALQYTRALKNQNALGTVQVLGSHFYAHLSSGDAYQWQQLADLTHLPLWNTEVHFEEGNSGDPTKRVRSIRDNLATLFDSNRRGVQGFVWWGNGIGPEWTAALRRRLVQTMLGATPVDTQPGYLALGNAPGASVNQAYRRGNTISLWICNPGSGARSRVITLKNSTPLAATVEFWSPKGPPSGRNQPQAIVDSKTGTVTIAPWPSQSVCLLTIGLRGQ